MHTVICGLRRSTILLLCVYIDLLSFPALLMFPACVLHRYRRSTYQQPWETGPIESCKGRVAGEDVEETEGRGAGEDVQEKGWAGRGRPRQWDLRENHPGVHVRVRVCACACIPTAVYPHAFAYLCLRACASRLGNSCDSSFVSLKHFVREICVPEFACAQDKRLAEEWGRSWGSCGSGRRRRA